MQTDLRRPIVTTKYQVCFDDAIVSNWMLKEMAGNGFHLNIVGALGMFALANVVPRDLVDGQIPGAIEWGLEAFSQWRCAKALRAKAFSQCRRD